MARKHTGPDAAQGQPPSRSEQPGTFPGLKLTKYTYFNDYAGTAAAFIAAGIVQPHQFPGLPGNGKTMMTFYKGERVKKGVSNIQRDSEYLQIRKAGKGFTVMVGLSEDECARREAERERQPQEATATASPSAASSNAVADLRIYARAMVILAMRTLAAHTPGDHARGKLDYPAQFAPEGFADIYDTLGEVLEWIEAAEITPTDRTALQWQAARADASFQAFLQSQCLGD